MSKFNTPQKTERVENFAGGEAFSQTSKLEFVSILLTSFVKDKFYESEDAGLERVKELMGKIPDKKFLAKSAIYARTKYGMRSISHVVAGEVAKMVKGEKWTRNFYDKVVYRPDDITEILSYYFTKYGKPYPNALKDGLARSFAKFNEYQLSKYKGEGNTLSLVDAVNIVHPKPVKGNKLALKKLIEGKLKSTGTWEAKLTDAGKKAKTDEEKEEMKKDVWVDLIKTKKIGYFALLRNLRNIIEQAPEIVDEAVELLTNEKLISTSLVLPFRYQTAVEQIGELNGMEARIVLVGIGKAMDIASKNVPKFKGTTVVVLDTSGSMEGQPLNIGALFAAILYKHNKADFMMFSEDAKYVTLNPMDSVVTIASQIKDKCEMGGTNSHAIFETLNKPYDRIIILSDMQTWVGYNAPTKTFDAYKKRVGANPKIYTFDLQGYGTMQFPQPNVYAMAGFSEKVFDVMKMLEEDKNALISEIEKIEL